MTALLAIITGFVTSGLVALIHLIWYKKMQQSKEVTDDEVRIRMQIKKATEGIAITGLINELNKRYDERPAKPTDPKE